MKTTGRSCFWKNILPWPTLEKQRTPPESMTNCCAISIHPHEQPAPQLGTWSCHLFLRQCSMAPISYSDICSPVSHRNTVYRRFSSVVEQLIRNERVISSNLISGSPLFQEDYLLKLTYLDLLAKVAEGNVWTLKVAFRRRLNGDRRHYRFTLAGVKSWLRSASVLTGVRHGQI
jgi:hypothetical protein